MSKLRGPARLNDVETNVNFSKIDMMLVIKQSLKGILKLVLTYIFFNLIVKTIQKYFACPYNP
jgi:hypothetical protein